MVFIEKKKKLNFMTDYGLGFLSLQGSCNLDFLIASLIPIPKSHTIHLMYFKIISKYSF